MLFYGATKKHGRAIIALVLLLIVLAALQRQFPGYIQNSLSPANLAALSQKIVLASDRQGFDAQILMVEGMPFLGNANAETLQRSRTRILTLSFYTLTRVNMTDPRTFFALQLPVAAKEQDVAYNPADPEKEGPILELVEEAPVEPGPPGAALVGIYSTHNSESYSGDGGPDHTPGGVGEIFQVGAAMAGALEREGLSVVRSEKIHDLPKFETAYSQSIKTANQIVKSNPKLQVLIDVHRDGRPSGMSKRTVTINGRPAAPVMIVLGTKHENWQTNENFAKELMAKGNAAYPGLFLPISYASDARYNQHLHPHALLLEFGDQYNTVEEAENAATAVAQVLAQITKR
ncbi:MAG TPA: stage II sporulation protein P [Verrucomicrobiae bacterium]|nr:stage II sporulation protein P [Verrucomicrobiae bacterium]